MTTRTTQVPAGAGSRKLNFAAFRKLTPQMVRSQQLAEQANLPDLTKSQASNTVKAASGALGLDGIPYQIMDILLGLSRKDDWSGTGRPVVAISNARLANLVNRSERTVIRSLKRLAELNLLAFRDSPTGRRYTAGHVEDAGAKKYGLDLTPIRARYHDIKALSDRHAQDFRRQRELRRELTGLGRQISDVVAAAYEMGVALGDIRKRAEAALAADAPDDEKLALLRTIYEEVMQMLLAAQAAQDGDDAGPGKGLKSTNMSPVSATSVTPLQPTILDTSDNSSKRTSARAADLKFAGSPAFRGSSKMAFEKTPLSNSRANPPNHGLALISLGLIDAATPQTQMLLNVAMTSWQALVQHATSLCHLIGLSEAGWKESCAAIGDKYAAAVLITTAEKALRDPDAIAKPAGYFRACVERAQGGALALDRSLRGLAAAA